MELSDIKSRTLSDEPAHAQGMRCIAPGFLIHFSPHQRDG